MQKNSDILEYFFLIFSRKIAHDISWKLSPWEKMGFYFSKKIGFDVSCEFSSGEIICI